MMSECDQRRYIVLLCLRCSNGGVTLHDAEVAFQLRVSDDEWQRTKSLLMSKNLIDADNHPVAWDKRQKRSDSSAERVAKHRDKAKLACNGDVTLQSRPVETETERETENKNTLIGKPAAKEKQEAASPVGFAEFWSAYPKKVGKIAAMKAWKRCNADLGEVLNAINRQKLGASWNKDGGQYIPNPATWINEGRWEDEGPRGVVTPPGWTPPKTGDTRTHPTNGASERFIEGTGWVLSA